MDYAVLTYCRSVDYLSGSDSRPWKPDQAFLKNNGDISLMFLSANSLFYQEPVQDPIYKATTVTSNRTQDGKLVPQYSSNYYVNPLGCLDQHQFCNPITQDCTELGPYDPILESARAKLNLSAMQDAIISTLYRDLQLSMISQSERLDIPSGLHLLSIARNSCSKYRS